MTNAEKYLKDGVDRVTFMIAFRQWYFSIERMAEPVDMTIEDFLRAACKPTLTEDEKAILRQMRKRKYIYRDDKGRLYSYFRLKEEYINLDYLMIDMYDHLFQFIKPRRRI